ncbi:sen54 Probable tRNA-splicing endonuclease subunit sen54 [Candida maltosa Xu316]|uniref:tRNA-splicing endonuclease subunit Sen54 N-terminal domain-containing protein n=1 Tax=Candida maltosa (strain Xu316) TaxID=1245528 RepID=M3JT70_CANMX|nr:hypothetical protein G210_3715 [Candida maltosa Xu316]
MSREEQQDDDNFQPEQTYDIEDEIQDWKFLNKSTIPKRGEKEFEPDGTTVQTTALEESQKAMFDALSNVRGHHVKNKLIGVWMDDYCLVPKIRGNHFKDIGKPMNIGKRIQGMKLNNVETIYLAERGSLVVYLGSDEYIQWLDDQEDEFDIETKLHALDLEFLYGLVNVPMAKYQAYAYLKRHGYMLQEREVIEKEVDITKTQTPSSASSFLLWPREWGILAYPTFHSLHFKTKHYFNYTDIYKGLKLDTQEVDYTPPSKPIHITYNVWKPSPSFSKKNPPPPDFQLCIIDTSKNTEFLTLPQIQMLHSELVPTQVIPSRKKDPKNESKKDIRAKKYAEKQMKLEDSVRLRNEYYRVRDDTFKNGENPVVVAVVNNGIMSFITLSQGQFTNIQHNKRLNEIYPNKLHSIIYN